ncbi:hypothetical protein AJ85_17175 [Alkalihalobacillus alcalophilus ATCC 27647 = CGMCC 1.3604]|uniref:Group-specific protein n=1 Tax=Alkalihalobacillus alcalophilus ATCC 27647 = CGMCC 1.3604 TaxID=1218173 RepID=A0A094XAQ9_ALKAL|nr:nucleoside 2-deoxyribosyltransferase [Alkalihalobacillus alcalophilus]KGA95860.1 group-specific protein [Alkalihalobacillus alcalophilus ATCC 27647 = CGMCC 1.3604]MED1563961.1 nucleoside 2-deoxyribosyltransferase [Alkalihalobacillus alcalophilus]THG92094.1 hypothetical protein AJ85_17175 [Alkalihalobacillus alcalophilus ATCC 27647 = CGMCC 1.3604]
MINFYIASSFANKGIVQKISRQLKQLGFIHTYDWTQNERVASYEQLRKIGEEEMKAVKRADFLVVLLPGGKGSHIELGIALGAEVPVYLYASDDRHNDFDKTSTFYHLKEVKQVIGTEADLINTILFDFPIKGEVEI